MTPKQQRFVEEYLIDLNAAAAYRRAEYKAKNDQVAAASAYKLLRNAEIASAIKAAQEARSERVEVTQDDVIRGLKKEAEFTGEGSSHAARVSAWSWLGKHRSMFQDNVNVKGGLTIQTVVGPPPAEILGVERNGHSTAERPV